LAIEEKKGAPISKGKEEEFEKEKKRKSLTLAPHLFGMRRQKEGKRGEKWAITARRPSSPPEGGKKKGRVLMQEGGEKGVAESNVTATPGYGHSPYDEKGKKKGEKGQEKKKEESGPFLLVFGGKKKKTNKTTKPCPVQQTEKKEKGGGFINARIYKRKKEGRSSGWQRRRRMCEGGGEKGPRRSVSGKRGRVLLVAASPRPQLGRKRETRSRMVGMSKRG